MTDRTSGVVPTFRSPLERHATSWLTARDVRWTYEEHTFQLDDGRLYTPDLWCDEIGVFIEVKGDKNPERLDKPCDLALQFDPHDVWHDGDSSATDEWWRVPVDARTALASGATEYASSAARRIPQVWIWTQTALYHAGPGFLGFHDCDACREWRDVSQRWSWYVGDHCDDGLDRCRSYWVTCTSCLRVQPSCTRALPCCRRCGGDVSSMQPNLTGVGAYAKVVW